MYHFLRSDLRRQVITFTYEDEDGWEHTHDFRGKPEVCSRCRGTGVTTEHIDGHGITMEEWERDWDDESREDYLSGRYDRPCPECNGNRVELVIDRDAADPKMLAMLDEWIRDENETRATYEAERRMGA